MNIKLYSKNAKLHPDSQLQKIALSLRTYGWRQPIIVDSKFVIIVGHGRYLAYEKYPEGIKQPWVVNDKGETINGGPEEKPLTDEEVRAYRLMDNKSNESQWDIDLVTEELKTLEFIQEEKGAFRRIVVNFKSEEDAQNFGNLIGQNLTDKTRSIWYPEEKYGSFTDKMYVSEP